MNILIHEALTTVSLTSELETEIVPTNEMKVDSS